VIAGSYDQNIYVLDAQGNESLNYLPGLSGIVNQPGYSAVGQSDDVIQSSGKKICNGEVQSSVLGCIALPHSEKVLVNTKDGNIYCFQLTEK
jgi:acyl-coenzyme A synthetase/AMP-(fatty) acid ligase